MPKRNIKVIRSEEIRNLVTFDRRLFDDKRLSLTHFGLLLYIDSMSEGTDYIIHPKEIAKGFAHHSEKEITEMMWNLSDWGYFVSREQQGADDDEE